MSPDLGIPGLVNAEVIGRGGYGTVYSVDEPEFGRKVAVKVLHNRLDSDGVRRAFDRECQAMGSLSGHPHIVSVLRGGTTAHDEPFIVMDLMSSGSLADRMAREGPLPWKEVLEIGVTVAGALETAHRAGILHLDIKPANLLVSRYGEPKLGDFGISRLPGVTETGDGQIRASIAYAAPERLLEGKTTVAADMYGLGATLFALLSGQPALTTSSGEDMLVAIGRLVRNQVPDLRPRGVPDPVARVVERLMSTSPEDRFATAADAATALQAAQQSTGRPVTRAVIEGAVSGAAESAIWLGRPWDAGPPPGPPDRARTATAAGGRPGTGAPVGPTLVGPPLLGAQGPGSQLAGSQLPGSQTPGSQPSRPPVPGPPVPARQAAPAPRRRALLVGGVAAAIVVLIGVTGALLLNRAATGETLTPTTGSAAPGSTAPGSTAPASATTRRPATSSPSVPGIEIAPGVNHPETTAVATVLSGFYDAINDGRYAAAFAVFSPGSDTAAGGMEGYSLGLSTTSIERPRINAVRSNGADGLAVDVAFRSRQDAEFGPDGQTCTDWALTYDMTGPGPNWKLLKSTPITPPRAC